MEMMNANISVDHEKGEQSQPNELQVDEQSSLFNTYGMQHKIYPSDYSKVREITSEIIVDAPSSFKEDKLLEQQISEIIKNAIKHGNKCQTEKKVMVWYTFSENARVIVEDEGEGFTNLEKWNQFNRERIRCFETGDFENMVKYVAYKDENSDETDGGNSLFAALEFWNGGMVYNHKKNKIAVARYYETP